MHRKNLFAPALLAALTVALVLPQVAVAHNWSCWTQPDRTVWTRNSASYWSEANAALNEWQSDTILSVPRTSSHTEVSVFDGSYGNTGWGGLASVESASGCNITHCHALLNYYYSYTSNGKRGIFCQEFGHCLGLDHSNDGGCMGGGYYYSINSNYNVVSHNISDIASKYANKSLALPAEKHGADPGSEPGGDTPLVHAVWVSHPKTLAEARNLSSAIVVARVTGVYDAPDLVVPVKGLEGDVHRVPNQRIAFDVVKRLHGRVDSSFDLFHTGNESYVLDGDPPYERDETYVLFLTPREDGTYRVISPEGRFAVTKHGLRANSHEEFAQVLQELSVADLRRDLAELAANGRELVRIPNR